MVHQAGRPSYVHMRSRVVQCLGNEACPSAGGQGSVLRWPKQAATRQTAGGMRVHRVCQQLRCVPVRPTQQAGCASAFRENWTRTSQKFQVRRDRPASGYDRCAHTFSSRLVTTLTLFNRARGLFGSLQRASTFATSTLALRLQPDSPNSSPPAKKLKMPPAAVPVSYDITRKSATRHSKVVRNTVLSIF